MTSHPEWNKETTATEVASVFSPQIEKKVVLVTGVSPNSLGESMALAISSQNPQMLILASLNRAKIDTVRRRILEKRPNNSNGGIVEIIGLDLSSQQSVRRAAEEISSILPDGKLDVLINSAGVMFPEHHFSEDGIESQFAINHIGPFLLTTLLIPSLLKAAKSSSPGATRVVNVTSAGHRLSPIRFSDFNLCKNTEELPIEERPAQGIPESMLPKSGQTYSGFYAYGQSKTANILTSVYITHKFGEQGILSVSVHPGSIWTELSRHLDQEMTKTIANTGGFWKSLDQGSSTMLVAAFDPNLTAESGVYLSDCQFATPAPHATDLATARRLWELSEVLVGEKVGSK